MYSVVHSKTVFENVASCHHILKGIIHFKLNSLLPISSFLEMIIKYYLYTNLRYGVLHKFKIRYWLYTIIAAFMDHSLKWKMRIVLFLFVSQHKINKYLADSLHQDWSLLKLSFFINTLFCCNMHLLRVPTTAYFVFGQV